MPCRRAEACHCTDRNEQTVCPFFDDQESGPVPQTQSPGPTPAEEPNPPPAEGALRTDAHFQETLCWLYGFAAGHADEGVRKSAVRQIQSLEDYLIYRREEIAERRPSTLDPRVTFSADWQQFDKLADRLSAMSAAVTVLHQDAEHLARHDVEALKTRLAELNTEIDAAIRNAQTLGLPF